jgi:FkbM family methyltransferase
MIAWLKRFAKALPDSLQFELRRHYYRWQIRHGRFQTLEPEFALLSTWIRDGDWVIDVGANVGHYTAELSRLVGPTGRVIAVEPIPTTFALLAANVCHFQYRNVTLLNAAITDRCDLVGMSVPKVADGKYLAHITGGTADREVLGLALDELDLPRKIRLMKIDVEGHELAVLRGSERILTEDQPMLIVEVTANATIDLLKCYGYEVQRFPGSPNTVGLPGRRQSWIEAT